MVRHRKKSRSHRSRKVPILATVGAAAYALNAYEGYKSGGTKGFVWNTVGVDASGNFSMTKFVMNVKAPAAGIIGSALASKFKLNRYISGIPVFKF
jgi:hypothetical protein